MLLIDRSCEAREGSRSLYPSNGEGVIFHPQQVEAPTYALPVRGGRKRERSTLPLYTLTYDLNIASRVAEVVAVLRVVSLWLSSVVTFACSREEQADRQLVVKKKREEATSTA